MKGFLGAISLTSCLLVASGAHGQTEADRAELIHQAQVAVQAGDHARALDLFQQAGQIRMRPFLLCQIAVEMEAIGHLTDALASATLCFRDLSTEPADVRARNQATAEQLLQRLNAEVGWIVLRVPQRPPNLRVRFNGTEVPNPTAGVRVPVNPGNLAVDADAQGMQPFHSESPITAGSTQNIELHFEPAPQPPVTPPNPQQTQPNTTPITTQPDTQPHPPTTQPETQQTPPTTAPVTQTTSQTPPHPDPTEIPVPPPRRPEPPDRTGAHVAGGILGGLGLAAIGVGIGAQIANYNTYGQYLSMHCDTNPTPTTNCVNTLGNADDWQTGEIVAFIAGGALLVAAPIVWFAAPSGSRRSTASAGVACMPQTGHLGLNCIGTF